MEDTTLKKTDSNPQIEVIKILTQQMLADSLTYNSTAVAAGDVDSREFDFGEDDEY